jgi:hypothetical protein
MVNLSGHLDSDKYMKTYFNYEEALENDKYPTTPKWHTHMFTVPQE